MNRSFATKFMLLVVMCSALTVVQGLKCDDNGQYEQYSFLSRINLNQSASVIRNATNAPGDGKQIQCLSKNKLCAVVTKASATCTNYGSKDDSNWMCDVFLGAHDLNVNHTNVLCEGRTGTNDTCVLIGSCVLEIDVEKAKTTSLWLIGGALFLAMSCILAVVVIQRRRQHSREELLNGDNHDEQP